MSQTSQTSHQPPSPPPAPAGNGGSRWRALVLLGALVALVGWSIVSGAFAAVAFILALIAVVMIHEAAHFVVAKRAGMKVTEFFFGFGPRLWSMRRGETEYGVKAIPAGGYVKIIGMSNLEKGIDPSEEARTYRQQSYPKRMAVALAGVVTHFVIAFVLLMVMWTAIGVPRYDRPTTEVGTLSRLESGPSPAQEAGFEVGDRLVSVDGQPITAWEDLPPYIRARPGQPITFVVERDGRAVTLTATPIDIDPAEGESVGFVGIGPKPTVERTGPVTAAGRSVSDIWRLTTGSVQALGAFFTPDSLRNYGELLTGEREQADEESTRFLSVVGVVRIAGQAAESGLFTFVFLLVLLNVFVAVFNLVPLPPFDGGHVAIATYERIRSRRGRRYYADASKLMPITALVLVVLVTIGVTALWLDIVSPLGNPFE